MKAVYSNSRYTVNNILEAIKRGNIRYYTNMPRNVFRAQQIAGPEPEPTVALGNRNKIGLGVSFLSDVAPRYPNCSFVTFTDNMYSVDRGYIVYLRSMFVFAEDEPLGCIEAVDEKLVFNNNRISDDVKRGNSKKTSKLSTAKAIFAKYFYGMTTLEHMQNVVSGAAALSGNTAHDLMRKERLASVAINELVAKKLAQGSQALMDFFVSEGETDIVDNLKAAKEEREVVRRIEQAMEANAGFYLMVKDDHYYTHRVGETTPKRYKRGDMPESMRTAFALLKLAEKETYVGGAGLKVDDDKFFILDEVKLEFDD